MEVIHSSFIFIFVNQNIYNRKIKFSLKKVITLPSWEIMAEYWKEEMLPDFNFAWKKDPREFCGVLMDPAEFIPLYLGRFLSRKEMEGKLPAPGKFAVEFKVKFSVQSECFPLKM